LRDTLRRVTFDQLITDTSCLPYPKSMLESKPLETNTSARGDLQ
jgi:hypothetical protein